MTLPVLLSLIVVLLVLAGVCIVVARSRHHPSHASPSARPTRSEEEPAPDGPLRSSPGAFAGEPFTTYGSPEHVANRKPHWNPYAGRAFGDDAVTYRAPRGTSLHGPPRWDPYAADQSRASRIKAARRRPRPLLRRQDYYALLGLERDASDVQIEQAYRRRASEVHPDKFFDDPVRRAEAETRLKQLNAAMQVLRDPVRRARYDASLS